MTNMLTLKENFQPVIRLRLNIVSKKAKKHQNLTFNNNNVELEMNINAERDFYNGCTGINRP